MRYTNTDSFASARPSVEHAADGATQGTSSTSTPPSLHGWRRRQPSRDPTLEFAIDFAEPRGIDPQALTLVVDVCPRAVYEPGEYMPLTLELTVHVRARPAPGPLLGRAKTRHLRDGYHEEDLDLWASKGTLVPQSRQLARLPNSSRGMPPSER